jgi:hypothetical protein
VCVLDLHVCVCACVCVCVCACVCVRLLSHTNCINAWPKYGVSWCMCRVGQNHIFIGLARTVYIHRIWQYLWWFPCQKYRIYTAYIWFWPTLHINMYINGNVCTVILAETHAYVQCISTVMANPVHVFWGCNLMWVCSFLSHKWMECA